MRYGLKFAGSLIFALAAPATVAQVLDVQVGTDAEIRLRPGFEPNPSGINSFSGEQLSVFLGDPNANGGGGIVSQSRIVNDLVSFQNGSISAGDYNGASASTFVDIVMRNELEVPVTTTLFSTIIPAGFGFFVTRFDGGCGPETLLSCSQLESGLGFSNLRPDPLTPPGGPIGQVSINFEVLADGAPVFSLLAEIDMVYDAQTGLISFVERIDDAAALLSNFGRVSDDGSPFGYVYAWDATPFDIVFPDGGTELLPGETRSLSYRTSTSTWTSARFLPNISYPFGDETLVAFAIFGDPCCRGGGGGGVESLAVEVVDFALPRFEAGELTFLPPAPGGIPEPATWAMLIAGFGLVGLKVRRRRPLIA